MNSPFLVIQEFFSPLTCEKIIQDIKVEAANVNEKGDPIKLEKHNIKWQNFIVDRFSSVIPEIEKKYECYYKGLQQPVFQHYPENAKQPAEQPGCENSKYMRKKWVMYKDVDLVGFIWLKDYNSSVPLDSIYEVMGGKLEFPAYNFSLVPQRGTLVLFPAGPHFITVISPILVGDLYQIKLNVNVNIEGNSKWFYNPHNFPGTWQEWFKDYF
jgi:hypothetical protein